MVISVTTSQVTPEQALQVEAFLHRFLPQLEREPGVTAVYHFTRPETGEMTTLIVWESEAARQAYRQGELIQQAMIVEQQLGLATTRESFPLAYASAK
jgi:heme-degrading monooxygenase HmoA